MASDLVTKDELIDAIAAVTADIRDTEERLRRDFTLSVGEVKDDIRIAHLDEKRQLDKQDRRLDLIYATLLAGMFTICAALVSLIFVIYHHG